MPFTLAHPAAVVPLRRWLPLRALVVGSLAPDLAHFVPLATTRSESHSLAGLAWFCLPAGMGMLLVYDLVLRSFGLAMLPETIARRLHPRPVAWSVRNTAVAAVAVTLGAVSHIVWDSFTHASGTMVRAYPLLRREIPLLEFYHPAMFTVLQHASTFAGLVVLGWLILRWYRVTPAGGLVHRVPLWVRLLVGIALFTAPLIAGAETLIPRLMASDSAFHTLQRALGSAMFAAGTAFLGALLLTALSWHAWRIASAYSRGCRTGE
jgi:hypothetical protein